MTHPPRDGGVQPKVLSPCPNGSESWGPRKVIYRAGAPAALANRALECVDYALAVFDTDDCLALCNDAYRDWHRVSGSTLVGLRFDQLLDAWLTRLQFADDEERALFRARRLQQRETSSAALEARSTDGRFLRISDRRAADGALVTTILDRTEDERQLVREREARLGLEATSTAKSEFLYSMSHELRTPLNAILGFSQLMARDTKLPLPDRHRTRVEHILKGGEHLLHLIDDLLNLSRIEAGKISIAPEPVAVSAMLEQLHATLGTAASNAGVRLLLRLPSGAVLPKVVADPTRLAQILMNFGSNAIKYNRPDGSVSLGASQPHPGRVRISVTDTGLGIPADQQDKLFQPFQRAGQERSEIAGTGLGLAISKRLAELMDGAIGFHSTAGEGSEFWLELPVSR